jgi:hypothetical protein
MAKIGRNALCPCGSGRKYKKCCLGKESPPRLFSGSAQPPPVEPPTAGVAPHGGMSPYVMAKLFEDSEQFARMARVEPQRARRFWTPRKLAALDTPAILARLHKLDVDGSPEAYLSLAEGRSSAWGISDQWRETINRPLSRYADDFLGLAACELWKRYCPEHPSIEMLDDAMQEGYRLSMQGEGARACDCWWKVWQSIRSRLHPKMCTTKSAAVVFDGTQCLFDWVQDFALELHNAAVVERRYGETGVRLCQEVLAQFRDEDELFVVNFRADLGEFHFLAAQHNDGERVLLELIRDHPERAAGYARLADLLGYGPTPNSKPIDLQRAQALIERALARPVTDAAQYDLETRLADLREHALKWQNQLIS